jgi:hypothetical protein
VAFGKSSASAFPHLQAKEQREAAALIRPAPGTL